MADENQDYLANFAVEIAYKAKELQIITRADAWSGDLERALKAAVREATDESPSNLVIVIWNAALGFLKDKINVPAGQEPSSEVEKLTVSIGQRASFYATKMAYEAKSVRADLYDPPITTDDQRLSIFGALKNAVIARLTDVLDADATTDDRLNGLGHALMLALNQVKKSGSEELEATIQTALMEAIIEWLPTVYPGESRYELNNRLAGFFIDSEDNPVTDCIERAASYISNRGSKTVFATPSPIVGLVKDEVLGALQRLAAARDAAYKPALEQLEIAAFVAVFSGQFQRLSTGNEYKKQGEATYCNQKIDAFCKQDKISGPVKNFLMESNTRDTIHKAVNRAYSRLEQLMKPDDGGIDLS